MTERTTSSKKIYQVAKEINISHETLIEYLVKRGHSVKSHMSAVNDAMMQDILSHFKKDKEVAEKHHRKIQTIRDARKRVEAKTAAAQEEAKTKTLHRQAREEEAVPAEAAPETAPPAEAPAQTPPAEEELMPVSGEAAGETAPSAEPPTPSLEAAAPPADAAVPAQAPPSEQPKAKQPESTLLPRRTPKMGLKIRGKVDLEEINRAAARHEGGAAAEKAKAESAEEAAKKKKKKKKRIRTEPTVGQPETEDAGKKGKKKKKLKHQSVDQEEVDQAIKRTLAEMDDTVTVQKTNFKKKRKEKRLLQEQKDLEDRKKEETILRVTEFVSVAELANMMGVNVADVIKKCIELGLMVSINQRLDRDTITLVADEFKFEVKFISEADEEAAEEAVPEDVSLLEQRPPIVTIMGHVDHGKTSLLDYIRQSNVVAGEAGGITQHIGAYQVEVTGNKYITFLDTPGHEAFTAMRARGAQLTDIVVLVVAADDNVMPQTVEAISHAQAANVPIIIAINKTDKADANPERIRQQLSERNVLVEDWGGKYQCVELSARTGRNVDLLLEKILLEAEVLDLKANAHIPARGTVIEAQVDKGKGTIATILVLKGTLSIGDAFIAGIQSGRVRAMYDERGRKIESAKPSTPAQILGFDGVPQAGDTFVVAESDRSAREISLHRQQLKREQDFRLIHSLSLDDLSKKIQEGQVKELKVIVKGDVDGSVGALADSLMKIVHPEVRINVIHRAVGSITESDVLLAAASGAFIIGFHVRPNLNARRLAEQESVDIRLYNIIYDAIDDVRKALEGLLSPEKKEEITASLEVRNIFKVPKVGTVAGCYVQDGKVARNNRVRLVRDGIVVFEGTFASLKRFKDDVREVEQGFECGLSLENFNDIKIGDTIETFKIIETMRKL